MTGNPARLAKVAPAAAAVAAETTVFLIHVLRGVEPAVAAVQVVVAEWAAAADRLAERRSES